MVHNFMYIYMYITTRLHGFIAITLRSPNTSGVKRNIGEEMKLPRRSPRKSPRKDLSEIH